MTEAKGQGPRLDQKEVATLIPANNESSEGINIFVTRLRTELYTAAFGFTPPLVLDHRPTKYIIAAVQGGLISQDLLPAALFNYDVVPYPGKVENFQINLTEFNPDDIKGTNRDKVDQQVSTSFEVRADLLTQGGTLEGHARRTYTLFPLPGRIARARGFKGWTKIYSPEELEAEKFLVLASSIPKNDNWRKIVYESTIKHERAIARGRRLEISAMEHPLQGGIPGQSKKKNIKIIFPTYYGRKTKSRLWKRCN